MAGEWLEDGSGKTSGRRVRFPTGVSEGCRGSKRPREREWWVQWDKGSQP